MKDSRDYIRDIAEIRAMMERSSKFLSLSGWAGIMAGIYALLGVYIAYEVLGFNPDEASYGSSSGNYFSRMPELILLAFIILLLALGTAVYFSISRARQKGEKVWNPTARRLLIHMAVPLVTGGLLILILISKGLLGLIAPFTLIFYGLALYNAGKFTYGEVRVMGLVQTALGLMGTYFIGYGLLFWILGFGLVHILYGIYMHYRYGQ